MINYVVRTGFRGKEMMLFLVVLPWQIATTVCLGGWADRMQGMSMMVAVAWCGVMEFGNEF